MNEKKTEPTQQINPLMDIRVTLCGQCQLLYGTVIAKNPQSQSKIITRNRPLVNNWAGSPPCPRCNAHDPTDPNPTKTYGYVVMWDYAPPKPPPKKKLTRRQKLLRLFKWRKRKNR